MRKICLIILIFCLFQTSAIMPEMFAWARDDVDEIDYIIDVDNVEDVNIENDSTDSIVYGTTTVAYDYTETGTQSGSYSSNIYQYDNFMESYFDNLTTNHGNNTIGSCGYVAIDMLLSYYDTYLNDDIVPENYDVPSIGDCNNMICRRNSPGSMFDMPKGYNESNYIDSNGNLDKVQKNIDYFNYVEKIKEDSLHAKLLTIGASFTGVNFPDLWPGLNHVLIKQVIHQYMADVLGFTNNSEYCIDDINYSLNANQSDEVRNFAIEKIQSGVPVLLWIGPEGESDTETGTEVQNGNGNTGSHWVVAYDYDEATDKIYCNFGWGRNSTYITPENYVEELGKDPEKYKNYYIYKSALTIEFALTHVCSNNYGVTEIVDGEVVTNYYCYHSEEIEVYRNLPTYTSHISTHDVLLECGDTSSYVHSFDHFNYDNEYHTSKCSECGYSFEIWHNWNCSVVDSIHFVTCKDCGLVLTSIPNISFISINETSHSIDCLGCDYAITQEHNFQYVDLTSTTHMKACTDCGYSVTSSHNFVYKSVNDDYHVLTCTVCGKTSGSMSSHSWTTVSSGGLLTGESVKCQFCGHIKLLEPGELVPVIKNKKDPEEETE